MPGSLKTLFTANIPTITPAISSASRNSCQQNFDKIPPGHPQSPNYPSKHSPHTDNSLLIMQILPCHSPASNPSIVLYGMIATNIYWEPCTVPATRATSQNQREKTSYIIETTVWGEVSLQTKHKDIDSMLGDKDTGKVDQAGYENEESRGWQIAP